MSEQVVNHIGYKKCRDNKIVMLEILGEHNENRKDIIDKPYAKYRCSRARVLEIYHMNNKLFKFNKAFGLHDSSFEYEIGQIIEPKLKYDKYSSITCTSGIHYFLTEEPAFFWSHTPANGIAKQWYDDGQLQLISTYKNGMLDGPFKEWHYNGNPKTECTYVNGEIDGIYKSYFSNGNIDEVISFRYGVLDGLREKWFCNGQINVRRNYNLGWLDGTYETWDNKGNLKVSCTYKYGKRDGMYGEFYADGKFMMRCVYKDGKLDGVREKWERNGKLRSRRYYENGQIKTGYLSGEKMKR